MKLLKNRGFAAAVMVLAIVLSSLYGLSKRPDVETPAGGRPLDEGLSTGAMSRYIVDDAGILSDKTERVNITLPSRVLRRIDRDAKAAGESRSGFIARRMLS